MRSYFLRRLLLVPVTFVAITLLIYTVLRLVPGGPIEQAEAQQRLAAMQEGGGSSAGIGEDSGAGLDEEAMRELQAYYALDRSIPVGYLQWLGVWPREKRSRVQAVPRDGNEEEIERLLAAQLALEAAEGDEAKEAAARQELSEAELAADLFLRSGRIPTRMVFRPVMELHEARTRVLAELEEHLDGLIEFRGKFYRPATEGELESGGDFLNEAKALALDGFSSRGDLLSHLDGKGWTWRDGVYYVAVAQSDRAERPEYFAVADGLLDALRLAAEKQATAKAEGYEVTEDGRLYRVENRRSGILQLDFGRSYTYNEPVLGLIGSKMEVSIQFGLIGYLLGWLICVPLGVVKAVKHRTGFDTGSSILVFLGYSIPGFVLCLILLSTVAVNVDWIPLGGYKPPNIDEMGFWEGIWGRIRHMMIPVAGYMIGGFASMTILMKNSLLENLGQDYVRTAFAKGLSEKRVIFVHAFRNSLIPITAGIGHALGLLFAGSFLIEKTCNIDGMGLLGFDAIVQRDFTIILGLQVFLVLVRLFGNMLSDLIWALIDPRIRFGK